jgi:hypothetical protein
MNDTHRQLGDLQDVFLIDMRSLNQGAFGFGFYRDARDLSGIVFFNDAAAVDERLHVMDGLWNSALSA